MWEFEEKVKKKKIKQKNNKVLNAITSYRKWAKQISLNTLFEWFYLQIVRKALDIVKTACGSSSKHARALFLPLLHFQSHSNSFFLFSFSKTQQTRINSLVDILKSKQKRQQLSQNESDSLTNIVLFTYNIFSSRLFLLFLVLIARRIHSLQMCFEHKHRPTQIRAKKKHMESKSTTNRIWKCCFFFFCCVLYEHRRSQKQEPSASRQWTKRAAIKR